MGATGLSKSLEWAVKNLIHELTVEDIAAKANMTRHRLEIAQELLENSDLNIEQIALKAG